MSAVATMPRTLEGDVLSALQPHDALVLGGGGAKGSFQVGVLGYLYRLQAFNPGIICGTSVGAVNGMKLAEGTASEDLRGHFGAPTGPQTGLPGLELIWLGLWKDADMYVPTPAFGALPYDVQASFLSGVKGQMTGLASEYLAGAVTTGLLGPFGLIAELDVASKVESLTTEAENVLNGLSFYELDPIRAMYDAKVDTSKVAHSGIDLLFAVTGLGSGELRYIRYDRAGSAKGGSAVGTMLGRNDLQTPLLQGIDMKSAVLASAANPIFLAPQTIGDDLYVDGGVREVVPYSAAIALGATRVFVVSCDPPMESEDASSHKDLAGLALRCLAIAVDEVERGDLILTQPTDAAVWTIRPGFPVHDPLTIDPGLIRINLDHGYMQGFDAVDGRVRSLRRRRLLAARSAAIAQLRVQCHLLETGTDTSDQAMTTLRELKSQIHDLYESRLRLAGQFSVRPEPTLDWPAKGSLTAATPDAVWTRFETSADPSRISRWPALWPSGFQKTGDPALSQEALDEERRCWIERQGSGGWCFQGTTGHQGDFELLVVREDAGSTVVAHYSRLNDENMAWKRNSDALGTGKDGAVPVSVSGFEGNYGASPNLEAVVRMHPKTGDDFLQGLWRDSSSGKWNTYDIRVEGNPISVASDTVMFQSTSGQQGDFEVFVVQPDGAGHTVLAHYSRLNDQNMVWRRNPDVVSAQTNGADPVSACVFQGNYGVPPSFEAVVRMHPSSGADFLTGATRESSSGGWVSYGIQFNGAPLEVLEDPVMFQSTAGRQGDFELFAIESDGNGATVLNNYVRMNDYQSPEWAGPYQIYPPPAAPAPGQQQPQRGEVTQARTRLTLGGSGSQQPAVPTSSAEAVTKMQLVGAPVSVTAFQGNYGRPPTLEPTGGMSATVMAHTNYEGVVRVRLPDSTDLLTGIWFDPQAQQWHTYPITVSGSEISW
jgi:NTE family protein